MSGKLVGSVVASTLALVGPRAALANPSTPPENSAPARLELSRVPRGLAVGGGVAVVLGLGLAATSVGLTIHANGLHEGSQWSPPDNQAALRTGSVATGYAGASLLLIGGVLLIVALVLPERKARALGRRWHPRPTAWSFLHGSLMGEPRFRSRNAGTFER